MKTLTANQTARTIPIHSASASKRSTSINQSSARDDQATEHLSDPPTLPQPLGTNAALKPATVESRSQAFSAVATMHPNSVPQEKSWLDTELCHRELLRAIPVAIYTCDERGIITFFNHAAADLWGRKPVIGQDSWGGCWKMYKRDGSPMLQGECPMAIALREGRSVPGKEIIIERLDGTRRYVVAYPEPIRDLAGAVAGAVNTLMDLTESDIGRNVLKAFVVRSSSSSTVRKAPTPSAARSVAN